MIIAYILLYAAAIIGGASGLMAMLVGTSAVHQILTAIYFLIMTVAVAALGVLAMLNKAAESRPHVASTPAPPRDIRPVAARQ